MGAFTWANGARDPKPFPLVDVPRFSPQGKCLGPSAQVSTVLKEGVEPPNSQCVYIARRALR